jgi:photosystem II stability/assembly factor-like uncharacterized protein
MKRIRTPLILSLFLLLGAVAGYGQWVKQNVNTTASFRGLSVVNEKVIWASGTGGTVIRTVNGGDSWDVMTVPDAEKLDFRDIEAFDANTAYILSIGNGDSSRIYKTIDGGKTWKLQFRNTDERAFFDAIACWDRINCIAMSDPVDNRFVLIDTHNGGATWERMNTDKMPVAKSGEAAFAASGTCRITQGRTNAFIVTGGSDARVFRTEDRGKTWRAFETPIIKGTPGSGIFSIAMRDRRHGVIVGGNYERPEEVNSNFAFTTDWSHPPKTYDPIAKSKDSAYEDFWGRAKNSLGGYRSGVAYINETTIVAVGPDGSDISSVDGVNVRKIGRENLNAVQAKGRRAIWAVGPNGLVAHLNLGSAATREDAVTIVEPYLVNDVRLSSNVLELACTQKVDSCSKVSVAVNAPAGDSEHKYVYTVTAGKIVGDGPNVQWDLSGVQAGTYTITAGISEPSPGGTEWRVFGRTVTKTLVIR